MKTFGIILGSGIDLKTFDKYIYDIKHIKFRGVHKKAIKEILYNGKKLIIFQGRTHFYETSDYEKIFYNVNYAKNKSVELLIITNAAGAINPYFKISDLMIMKSHINFMGKLLKNWGYYPYYDKKFIERIFKLTNDNSIDIQKGVYCALTGPAYETRTEIKFLRKIGVDSVGMSTVPEIYLCSKCGIKTLGISIITNILKEFSTEIIEHEKVLNSAKKASAKLQYLIELILNEI